MSQRRTCLTMHTDPEQELDEHNSEMSLHLLEDDIPPAWVRESNNDLRMDMKMMFIDSQSLPENIHAVVFIIDNHTARLLGGSGKLPIFWADLQNPFSMIF